MENTIQDVSGPPPEAATPEAAGALQGASLKQKGIWTLLFLFVYCLVVSVVITAERRHLLDSVAQLEDLHQRGERQVALNMSVARAILVINENYFSPDIEESAKLLVLEIEAVLSGVVRLQPDYPSVVNHVTMLQQGIQQLLRSPSRAVIADVRSGFHHLVIDLDAITSDISDQKMRVLDSYRGTHKRLTWEWVAFGVAGVGFLGGLMMLFFRRLARDINLVRERAVAIVRGYRGDPLPVARHDELGALMLAINEMQHELRGREMQIEMNRQQQFHKEKMAAVGSLAAAVAHEINNPLSAIVGIAQSIADESQSHSCRANGAPCQPELILEQAKRVMHITRQIGEFSVPQSPNPELMDVNGLVRSTCSFVSFDRRFRLLKLDLALDSNLPAIYVVADHLVQVAMNLLINAADALQDRHDPAPTIRVSTSSRDGKVAIEVCDNGAGIDPAHLGRVFDEYFSTKGRGRGSGLGLSLCRSLIRSAGGDITIVSVAGSGTTVTVTLPILPMGDVKAEQ